MGDLNLLDSSRVPARIDSTDWKNPAPTVQIAESRVREALSVLISHQSDIWDMGAQIQRFEELGGDPEQVGRFRQQLENITDPCSI